MTTQLNPAVYAQCIQYQLKSILSTIPVYANFNRNFAKEPKFVTWQLRNVHQPVYTGNTQSVKGIDTPIVQINLFAQNYADVLTLENTIVQALHGWSGSLGGLVYVSKIDISMLYNTYDDQVKLHQIILDCRMDIPC